ncbi:hypothetical protein L1887_31456 [Cichorium endivia]|nr:hypothetical protein L1887_31456 [Cichorium endivia]
MISWHDRPNDRFAPHYCNSSSSSSSSTSKRQLYLFFNSFNILPKITTEKNKNKTTQHPDLAYYRSFPFLTQLQVLVA